ncbi:MAG: hypothetical protein IJI54_02635 [Kiritimatiellae bacterium]|nr:hypothetical protein [Kiritimatiellia bacterium]
MKTNYVLIDFENVTPDNLDLLDQEWIRVLLFVGKNQTKLPFPMVKAIQKLGSRAEYVEMTGTGHNALDFHIAFYIGRISMTDKDAYFHIVSNDTGFDPLITHLKQEHIFADRVSKIEEIPALAQPSVMSPVERIDYAKERLARPNVTRPRTCKTLSSHVMALFHKTLSEDDVAAVVEGLFKCGCVREDGKRLVYSDETV